ncbi:MAG TPA: chromosomal replication initiator protein DnaA [Planctomycetota bacterium]|nr:chromosomal replication initiator protein DnaA [Planctomycetota bacterium]
MSTQAHVGLWAEVQADLRLKLGEELFALWIAPLKVLSGEGDEVRLGVPNVFVLDWITKRYLREIESVLAARAGPGTRVVLSIDPQLYQERRREREKVLGPETGPATVPAPVPPTVSSTVLVPASGPVARDDNAVGGSCDEAKPTLENFVVGPSNQHAFNAVMDVLSRPGRVYNPLFICGPTGVGKTHLLKGLHRALRSRRRSSVPGAAPAAPPTVEGRAEASPGAHPFLRVSCLSGEQFFQHYVQSLQDRTLRKFQERFRSLDVLIIDDVHLLRNKKKTQAEFLHTFSALVDSGKQVILASDVPPRSLGDLEPGLVGRFLSGLVVGMKRPDFATRLGIARAVVRRLSARFEEPLLQFLAENLHGNAREIIGAINQLHHHAQTQGRTMNVEEARRVLEDFFRERERRVDFKRVHAVVASYYGVPLDALVSGNRQRHIAFARQVAMYLARKYLPKSLAEVGKYFGNRNHTTVRCAAEKVARLLEKDGCQLARDLDTICEILEE